jgi:hypothetical protein
VVQEISSAIHYLPCFGGGLLLCSFTGISTLGVYFFARLLSLGQVVFQLPTPLSMLDYSSLFISFVGQFGFGCCSLTEEMSSVIHYLPCFREWLIAQLLSAFAAFPVFIY